MFRPLLRSALVRPFYEASSHGSPLFGSKIEKLDKIRQLRSSCLSDGRSTPRPLVYRPQITEQMKRKMYTRLNHFAFHAYERFKWVSYIDAAFRSSRENEVYLFIGSGAYVLLNYASGTMDDRVVNGPLRISQGFPLLTDSHFAFTGYGVDCAFRSHHGDEAFLFVGSQCAQINYAPGTTNCKIIKGNMLISDMFGFLEGTKFEHRFDAAFESSTTDEAYIFRGDQYALINYSSHNPHLIVTQHIIEGFPSLKGTIFESGIHAAFASHRCNEAYLFKRDSCACINFADDKIIGGVKKITDNWPSLDDILPVECFGIYGCHPVECRDIYV